MAGFSPGATLLAILAVSVLAAATGLAGQAAGIAERHLFWLFLALFAGYAVLMHVSWRRSRFLGRDLDRRLAGGRPRRSGGERRQGDRRDGRKRRDGDDRRRPPEEGSGEG